MVDKCIKNQGLEFGPMDGDQFIKLLKVHAKSEVGSVSSQYEKELNEKDESCGVFSLKACDRIIGAISYGLTNLKREPTCVVGRLDTVVTIEECRKNGVGNLLMLSLFDWFIDSHGEKMRGISTMAVHPTVVSCVTKLGFSPPSQYAKAPLYSLSFENISREKFHEQVVKQLREILSHLRLECIKCNKFKWSAPWCKNSDIGKELV
ncbi:hypothetical protein BVY03_01670 [bacterium K02(2017)]|nr:hypothetical protein BVY03_01670 [bacterium K02(2017)]